MSIIRHFRRKRQNPYPDELAQFIARMAEELIPGQAPSSSYFSYALGEWQEQALRPAPPAEEGGTAGAEGSLSAGGLSPGLVPPNQQRIQGGRVAYLVDKETGELLPLDRAKARLRRMRKRLGAWANWVREEWPKAFCIMVTLTYRQVDGWKPNHIRGFMTTIRNWCDRHGKPLVAYCWVAELQRRGAVHYHVCLVFRHAVRLPKPDEVGWWKYGSTRIEKVKKSVWGYLRKYLSKMEEVTQFPAGLRLFATTIRARVGNWLRRAYQRFRISTFPGWLTSILRQVRYPFLLWPRRKPGGGWLLGWRYEIPQDSPYKLVWLSS